MPRRNLFAEVFYPQRTDRFILLKNSSKKFRSKNLKNSQYLMFNLLFNVLL